MEYLEHCFLGDSVRVVPVAGDGMGQTAKPRIAMHGQSFERGGTVRQLGPREDNKLGDIPIHGRSSRGSSLNPRHLRARLSAVRGDANRFTHQRHVRNAGFTVFGHHKGAKRLDCLDLSLDAGDGDPGAFRK